VQRKFKDMAKGNAIPHLQITELAKFPISVPSASDQKEFVTRIRQHSIILGCYEKALSVEESLFFSLQHRAFAGEL